MATQLTGFHTERRSAPRYRVHSLCIGDGMDGPFSGRLQDISGTGAYIATTARPALGSAVALRHPVAGIMASTVSRHDNEGIALAFNVGSDSVTFALRVIAADMSESHVAAAAF